MQAITPCPMGAAERGWVEGDLHAGDRVFRRVRDGLIWRFDSGRWGVRLDSFDSDPARVAHALREWSALLPPHPFELLVDWRGLRLVSVGAELDALPHVIDRGLEALGTRLTRLVAVTPNDWSRPWWYGLHAVAEVGCPWRVLHELAPAVQWLGLPESLEAELAALPPRRPTSMAAHVKAALMTRLEADTEEVARMLKMSTRSLQRALELEGVTFLAVRDQVRLEAAYASLRRGDKVDGTASEVGFASTSHFVRWFRQRAGVTPSDFRRLGMTKGP